MSCCNPVDVIAKLQTFHEGKQDTFLNTLAFSLQLASLLTRSQTNIKNPTSLGLANVAGHINSSRFVLRFLLGARSVHKLIQQRDVMKQFFNNFSLKNASNTKGYDIIPVLRYIQHILTLLYNCAEVPSYIAAVAPTLLVSGQLNGDYYGKLSCRFWCANTILELIIQVLLRMRKQTPGSHFRYALVPLLCDTVLAANWSVDPSNQFLSEWALVGCGFVSAWMKFIAEWQDTDANDPVNNNNPEKNSKIGAYDQIDKPHMTRTDIE